MDQLTALTFDAWSVLTQTLLFGIALAFAVRIALAMLSPANASTRFAVWFVTLIAIALLPPALLLKAVAPRLNTPPATHAVSGAGLQPARDFSPAPAAPLTSPRPIEHTPSKSSPLFQTELLISFDAAAGFLAIYACIAAALLFGRLGFSYIRLRWLKARATPAPPEVLERFEAWRASCPTSRSVRVLLSTKTQSPLAAGFSAPAIILPDSLLLRLTGEELDYIGIHELAHLRRGDDWTNLVQRIIQALLFFHPAVHWISRRLDFEREVACDDQVLLAAGDAKPYAKSLAKILESVPWLGGPVLASGAVFRKRQIFRRIEMMFDRSRDSRPRVSQVTLLLILLCVCGAVAQIIQMPALVAFGNDPGGSWNRSRWDIDGRRIEAEMRGDIQFGYDDLYVESISPGGYLKVSEGKWNTRQIDIRSGDAARPVFRYLENGRERPFDQKAREWASSILAFVVREHGIDAERRALRILEKRGPSGIFEEIDRIMSDHSRQQYLAAVIQSGQLNSEDLRRAIVRAGRISSDNDKANLLVEVLRFYNSDPLSGAYFDALNTIGSDHDRGRVLAEVIDRSGGDTAILARVGRSVEQMSSDHDKSQVLQMPALRMLDNDAAARRPLIKAAESIGSDNDKAAVLTSMLAGGTLPADVLDDVLRAAAKIRSDHDKSKVLQVAARQDLTPASTQSAFIAAADTINADNEKARALCTIIERDFSATLADDLARSIERISSDHDKANVLIKLAAKGTTPGFFNAVRSINSDSDKRRVIQAMVDRGNSVETAKNAVALAATIGSDHDKAELLAGMTEKYRDSPEVREAIRRAAAKISSDSDYRRVVSRLLP